MCSYNMSSADNATFQRCFSAAKKFKSEFKICFNAKSTEDSCSCVDTIDTDNLKVLEDCDTKTESDKITAKKKECIKSKVRFKDLFHFH